MRRQGAAGSARDAPEIGTVFVENQKLAVSRRIALRERATGAFLPDGTRGGEFHVLDRWMYLGSARSEEELAYLGQRPAFPVFDVDVYRILQRYFSTHPSLDWHDLRAAKTAALH